jgi:hypothetical protein
MNRKLTAAVFTVLMSGSAMAVPPATSFQSIRDQAAISASKSDAKPRQGDFPAPQANPYAARKLLDIHSARPTEEELACVTWGSCKPGGRHV